MNATPQSPQGSEREELSRLLPAPADPDLTRDRHRLLKEHLMNHVQEESRLTARRWRLAMRFAAPVALAAAVAGVAVSTGQTTGDTDTATVAAGPHRINTVAYTLDHKTDDAVQVTLRAGATPTANAAQLQKDLAAMGIQAQVAKGGPRTIPAIIHYAQRDKNGDFVATLYPKLVSKYPTTIVFSLKDNDANALTITLGAK
ncbi:hypothetical protein [Streptomyces sp. NPDC000410]|uniref:hypothetical protein n=1 Tax=Streptomyces sp. NPDC000410 TaxID=3154254 RepID=UPI0033202E68